MQEVVGQAAGVTVALDIEQLGRVVGKQVAVELADLFPSDAAEFWTTLCQQAERERHRVAAMLSLACPDPDHCPHQTVVHTDDCSGQRIEDAPDRERPDGRL